MNLEMDIAFNSAGEAKDILLNEVDNKAETRVCVLRDLKGLHVVLRRDRSAVRNDGTQFNHKEMDNDSPTFKKEGKSIEDRQNIVHDNSRPGKSDSSKLVERLKGLVLDRLIATSPLIPKKRRNLPQQINQEKGKQRCTLDGAASIKEFFKTGILHISESNVFGILEMSFQLKLISIYNACLLLLSQSLRIGNWIEIWRLSKKFHLHTLSVQVLSSMEQHITDCLMKKDQVSVVASLTQSNNDVQSFEFLLQFLLCREYKNKRKTKVPMIRLLSELMKKDSMIWRCYFKEYLEHYEQMNIYTNETDARKSKKILKSDSNETTKSKTERVNKTAPSRKRFKTNECHNLMVPISLETGKLTAIPHEKKVTDGLDKNTTNDIKTQNIKNNCHCITRTTKGKGILVTGGIQHDNTLEPLDLVFLYEPDTDTWTKLPSLTHARFNHSMVTLHGNVYVMGGKSKYKHSSTANETKSYDEQKEVELKRQYKHIQCSHLNMKTCYENKQRDTDRQKLLKMYKNPHVAAVSFDFSFNFNQLKESRSCSWLSQNQMSSVEYFSTHSNKWNEVSSMILLRKEHCSIVVRNFMYVIGGHDGVTQLCSIEKYDLIKDEWSLESPMARLCTGMNAVTDGRLIYVIGGYTGIEWLDTISCYDALNKTWTSNEYPTMKKKRGFAGAELLAGDIFVFGGINGVVSLDKCEVFNIKSNTWRKGPHMNQPRFNAGHCVFGAKIFVFGGESNGNFLNTVEYLDIAKWEWKMVNKMPIKTAGLRCAPCIV
jgi:hypothetical protein